MKVTIRIAVAVDADGTWACAGWPGVDKRALMDQAIDCIPDGEACRYWLEAELDAPADVPTITVPAIPDSTVPGGKK